ncbi:MAG: cell division protein FtsZ [Cytophagales bacterium]
MTDTFEDMKPPENQKKKIIMCVGVGGGGCNIINHMHRQGIKDVILVVANTDGQALAASPVPTKIQLGPHTTRGLGAGANPKIGEQAALESKAEIEKLFTRTTPAMPDIAEGTSLAAESDIKMVFFVGGEGGGTGTGALPVFAEIAKQQDEGILVVGMVTTPFNFEGRKKKDIANKGILKLQENCDTLITIQNERLMDENNTTRNFSLHNGFLMINEVACEVMKSITYSINEPSLINLDFHDVKTMLSQSGHAVIGTGVAEGEDRGKRAVVQALNSPFLKHSDIRGCTRLLFSVVSGMEGGEITLTELSEITKTIQEKLDNDDAMVIWGHSYAKGLANKVKISIIASGFPNDKEPTTTDKPSTNPSSPSSPTAQQVVSKNSFTHQSDISKKTSDVPQSFNPANESAAHDNRYSQHNNEATSLHQTHQPWEPESAHLQHRSDEDWPKLTEQEIKELVSVPAYVRKNISLDYRLFTDGTPPIRHRLN